MTAPLMPNEFKRAPLDHTAVDAEGTFEGYASLFNIVDLAHDIILPGAFRDTLASRGTGGIRMLFEHDPGEPIGIWEHLSEDARGLKVRGRLLLDVTRAREALALMRAGALDGLSIGFRTEKGVRDARSGIRKLAKIDLWEISVVTFPMQPGALISTVKSGAATDDAAFREGLGEAVLRMNELSRTTHRKTRTR